MYSTFVAAESLGRYITDNYITLANNLLVLTSK